jgi:hypothetical protein
LGGAEVRLGDGSVADIVKRCAAAANLDPSAFSGHSLRAGLVAEATRQGRTPPQLDAQRSFAAALPDHYLRRGDLWADNPAARIGL